MSFLRLSGPVSFVYIWREIVRSSTEAKHGEHEGLSNVSLRPPCGLIRFKCHAKTSSIPAVFGFNPCLVGDPKMSSHIYAAHWSSPPSNRSWITTNSILEAILHYVTSHT